MLRECRIIFSDGALLAFGTAAYIRWKLKSGGYWTRLVMAKSTNTFDGDSLKGWAWVAGMLEGLGLGGR